LSYPKCAGAIQNTLGSCYHKEVLKANSLITGKYIELNHNGPLSLMFLVAMLPHPLLEFKLTRFDKSN